MNEKPERGSRRWGRWVALGLVLAAIADVLFFYRMEIYRSANLTWATLKYAAAPKPTVTESVNTYAYFYRLKARYSYGKEPVDFDVVVGCSVQITRYRGGNSGFLAARYPRFFVHETSDGHAVMQILPIACRGETTESGIVPADFLPGVIWFDTFGDYRFGIAYVSEDAFESPNGKLKFHGASVYRATREEWDAFRARAAGNEGMRKRYYAGSIDTSRLVASSGGREIEAAYAPGCSGVVRYKLSESGRAVVRKYWPGGKPRYWATKTADIEVWRKLEKLDGSTPIFANGFRIREHFLRGSYKYGGFPTRARGGTLHSRSYKLMPPEFFPTRSDRGIPWAFTEQVARSKYLDEDVEVRTGLGKGFLYCFRQVTPGGGNLALVLPDYRSRYSRIRVDGTPVVTPEPRQWSWPALFFEKDEYVYFIASVGLS